MSNNTYEFTAFAESDLISDGTTMSVGASITLPVFATTTFDIADQDNKLSGAGYSAANGAFAQDGNGQTGTIDGTATDGQIYASRTWELMDDAGNTYILIEIEQEGSDDGYFTFYSGGAYTVPPPDTDLKVISSDIAPRDTQGNVMPIDYGDLSAGTVAPPTFSGTYFCDTDNDSINDGDPPVVDAFVFLFSADGTEVDQTTTGVSGEYFFENLAPGEYYVVFDPDVGKSFVTPDVGDDDSVDSDVIDASGRTGIYFVEDRFTSFANVDAGIAYDTEAAAAETSVDDFIF